MDEAIEDLEARKGGEELGYRKTAKIFGVDESTLRRRHQGKCATRAQAAQANQLLHPQQEEELLKYIEALTERALPPTKAMVASFASQISKKEVGVNWVGRFLSRNQDRITPKWTTAIDRNRHKADSESSYSDYFTVLENKLEKYEILPKNVYNMDEKGFLLGHLKRSLRIFNKASWKSGKVKAPLQDGSREWITIFGCVCGDGSSLSPAIIYQGVKGIQSSWLEDVDLSKHHAFFSYSESGWSNDDLGLAWLKEVFHKQTKEKARREYRLLILDGHGSHLTMDFINFCNKQKIILVVFPPHATHTLQPLDVVLYGPLSGAYSQQLTTYLHNSQGLLTVKKGDFFSLFWAAWTSSFTAENILSSFRHTGIIPLNADLVLKKFEKSTTEQGESSTSEHIGDGSTWREIRGLITSSVKDPNSKEAKKLSAAFHSLQTQIELRDFENKALRGSLETKKKRKKKTYTLELGGPRENTGGAMFFTPSKVKEAQFIERMKQQDKEAETLRKAEEKERKAEASAIKKGEKEQAKVAREEAKKSE
jgi:hypothetical protein